MNETAAPEHWHDPELPFLDVLEQDVRRRAEQAAIRHQQRQHLSFSGQRPLTASLSAGRTHAQGSDLRSKGAAFPPRRGRDLPRTSLRIARRSLTLVALLCLIGASAYGASEVFSSRSANPVTPKRGAFAVVASGHLGADSWVLRLYTRGGELCRVLSVAETEASQCGATPLPGGVQATSLQSPSSHYVFGVTGIDVKDVRVRLGKQRQTIPTRAPGSAQRRIASLPAHVRYYLDALPRSSAQHSLAALALIQGIGGDGRALGKPVPSCPETGEPGGC